MTIKTLTLSDMGVWFSVEHKFIAAHTATCSHIFQFESKLAMNIIEHHSRRRIFIRKATEPIAHIVPEIHAATTLATILPDYLEAIMQVRRILQAKGTDISHLHKSSD